MGKGWWAGGILLAIVIIAAFIRFGPYDEPRNFFWDTYSAQKESPLWWMWPVIIILLAVGFYVIYRLSRE